MTRRLIPLFVALALFAAACGSDTIDTETGQGPASTTTSTSTTTTTAPVEDDSPAGQLAAARARWAEHAPASYVLTTRQLCFCPESVWADTVVDGEVVGHVALSDDAFFDPGGTTMEGLFDEVDAAITSGFAALDLEFDPDTGALVRYWVDVDERTADEEHGVEVMLLEPLDDDATDIDVPTLTDDYPCGFGFAKGSPNEDLALVIQFDGFTSPDLGEPIVFPTDRWFGEIRIGSDLFSNWCDDVIEESEPTPVVDRRLRLSGGTLTIIRPADSTDCDGTTVTATLSGGTVRTLDGTVVELGDVDLANAGWGCFAG